MMNRPSMGNKKSRSIDTGNVKVENEAQSYSDVYQDTTNDSLKPKQYDKNADLILQQ